MIIGNVNFDTSNETYIMGILNITPDSFYDGGCHDTIDKALARADEMIMEGADIIDIGGMSTKPGYAAISCEEEIQRAVPVVREIRKRFAVPLSIDTYRPKVAMEALEAGADMVNDIRGAECGQMSAVIAKYNVPCCIVHNSKSNVASADGAIAGLKRCIDDALNHGIGSSNIIIDPGIGYAKDPQTNLRVIKEMGRFSELGYPLLLGASRKSLIGNVLNLKERDRLEGTLAITAYVTLMARVAFLRVHDVKENVRMLRMLRAIANA